MDRVALLKLMKENNFGQYHLNRICSLLALGNDHFQGSVLARQISLIEYCEYHKMLDKLAQAVQTVIDTSEGSPDSEKYKSLLDERLANRDPDAIFDTLRFLLARAS